MFDSTIVRQPDCCSAARRRPGDPRFKRRVGLRCEKTAKSYSSFVALALGFILIKSIHKT
jgi:hypothetical protein